MENDTYKTAYGVGDGYLYIAPGRLTETQLRTSEHLAGESEGGCRLKYTARTFPVTDIHGNRVKTLRYGEKTSISGRLKRLDMGVLSALTGCRLERETDRDTLLLGESSNEDEVSAMLVCPLPDGEEFVASVRGAAVSSLDMKLCCGRDSSAAFEITADGQGGRLWIGGEGGVS